MLQPSIVTSALRNAAGYRFLLKAARQYATIAEETVSAAVDLSESAVQTKRKKSNRLIQSFVPRTPGTRHLKRVINDHLWKGRPFLPLTIPKKGHSKGGRNNTGQVTVRHRGGGVKRRIRTVDFERKIGGSQLVERIEYDPGRSAHIALLKHQQTDQRSYIVAADGLRAGDVVQSYRAGIPKSLVDEMGGRIDPGVMAAKTIINGNCLPVQLIPPGTRIFCVGSADFRGAVFCRSAGTHATVIGKDLSTPQFKYMMVKLQSGETRKVAKNACATIGVASNTAWQFRQLGKAGRSRWLNIRPTVRGVAMNACDHPHGGGRGKSKGNRNPVSPWGVLAKGGFKTRPRKRVNHWVTQPRERNQGKRRRVD